ncbi:hypothetical protein [Cryptosporangium aurantiacum]|uniref:Uncharacterized protein n=1 Tax=Cryptosporangium aurantiacum TaxID=134849 RepID=A0A1M7QR62_9ACTN|nr:hypothetical protein [Cryptosporangium aurantiacum]SHN34132.1 hypothetical protein SAMN05443668_105223 [Cryptosporangium aurantiacum]
MTLANPSTTALGGRSGDHVGPVDVGLPAVLTRAVDWAKQRRRRRYVAAVKRRLRRYDPPAGR